MNWANRLTLSRLVFTLLFVVALGSSWRYAHVAALTLFVIASVTDLADGEVARRYAAITNFGKLMDPLVDKIMIASAFICLVSLNAVPAWAAVAVVARDFLITGLRLMASARGQVLGAEKLGKHKTTWQMITVSFFLIMLAAREGGYTETSSIWWHRGWEVAGPVLTYITVALTIYSGLAYAWRHREVIAADV